MKNKASVTLVIALVGLILLTGACSAGFVVGRVLTPGSVVQLPALPWLSANAGGADSAQRATTPSELQDLFAPFWQTWNLVHDQYVDQPVDDLALMRGAIKGMLEALGDPHTSYLDPSQTERLNAQLNGDEYEGIGAWVDVSRDYLTIISPMPGSPADKAGLLPGDQILAVDGENMTGVDGQIVRQKVIGPKGSQVRLTVLRQGVEQPFDVEVTRDAIIVPTVESRMLDGNIGYVHLFTFGDQTENDLRSTLQDLLDQNPDGLILDLRNNGGGYLDTAISVVSEFVGSGVVMYEQYGDGRKITYEAQPDGLATQIPLVVLINQGSASASEIVAGAIQDTGRGQLVGMTSYGKGSVQTVVPLVNDQGEARVTIAAWLTPSGKTINEIGLTPDVEVQLTDEDHGAGRDPQLDKALELLTQQ